MNSSTEVSVIIPISERLDEVEQLYRDYKAEVSKVSSNYEFIYVIDGPFPEAIETLNKLKDNGEPIILIRFAKWFGEATALTAGFDIAKGEIILTLPAYHQVEANVISDLVTPLEDAELVVAVRSRPKDSKIKRLQGNIFNGLVSRLSGYNFNDLGCSVRAMKRIVIDEIKIYGDQHRFLPILASQLGFRVIELDADQHPRDVGTRYYNPGIYLRRLLDIVTVFFLTKFTKKPLRFFGIVGSTTAAAGAVIVSYLVIDRLFGNMALAERPALLLGSLLIVLGIQMFAIGLIGELIIFTHARHIKEYQIEQSINLSGDGN